MPQVASGHDWMYAISWRLCATPAGTASRVCVPRTPLAFFASLATFFADDVSGNRMRLLRHYAPAPVCCAVFRAGHAR